jgi:hypothetical protein
MANKLVVGFSVTLIGDGMDTTLRVDLGRDAVSWSGGIIDTPPVAHATDVINVGGYSGIVTTSFAHGVVTFTFTPAPSGVVSLGAQLAF